MKKIIFSHFTILFIIGVIFLSFLCTEEAKGQVANPSAWQAGKNIPKPNVQPTQLWSRGHSVIPSPRSVELEAGEVLINGEWNIKIEGVPTGDITVDFMKKDLWEFHGIELKGTTDLVIYLQVKQGTVKTGGKQEIEKDAYRLVVKPGEISIVGNSPSGLFYGAQTFLQLLKVTNDGSVVLPECTITDWPEVELRMIHWDTKKHQDRMETLKRYLDWAARFKMNGIAFEVWDKFAFPSHPVIGVPGAFTPQQLQELVDYGLARHIQIIPDVQAPAHFSWVLRHPEFAHLRNDLIPNSACICDERTYELIFELYNDLIKSTIGVDYFLASTDELFTVGGCQKCDKPYTPENKSLYFVEFANRADKYLRSKGRKTIAWLEMPLLTEHVKLLNPEIIDGVGNGHLGYFVDDKAFIDEENKKGIKLINYTPIQGGDKLVPNMGTRYKAFEELSYGLAWRGDVIGTFIAAWDDAALHNETFWLGWSIGAQYSWTPGTPSVEQTTMEFMNIYYGPEATDMVEVYRALDEGARFYQSSVGKMQASDIKRGGNWGGEKYKSYRGEFEGRINIPSLPPLPNMGDPSYTPVYHEKFAPEIKQAGEMIKENDLLRHRIHENISKTDRNDYNLRVLLSLTDFIRHHMDLITGLATVEDLFKNAVENAQKGDHPYAISQLNEAKVLIKRIIEDRENTFQKLKETFGVSQIHSIGLHDLSFMISPERALQLEDYVYILEDNIKDYGEKNGLDGFYDALESRPLIPPPAVDAVWW